MNVKLDVCIAAYREKGLNKIMTLNHPEMEGVRYIVAWQYAQDSPDVIPQELLNRKDFVIIPNDTKGSGANRNVALEKASAPLVLISDDDVSYTEEQLSNIISAFENRPNCDFIIGHYHSVANPYSYPSEEFDFRQQPKGFSFGGPVTAFRLGRVREKEIIFNPLFGVNAYFMTGEDTLFVYEMSKKGLEGHYVPITFCGHEDISTGKRAAKERGFIRAKGAFMAIIYPITWPLRMMTHALREASGFKERLNYCKAWLSGSWDLLKFNLGYNVYSFLHE